MRASFAQRGEMVGVGVVKTCLVFFLDFSWSGCGRVNRLKTQSAYWQTSWEKLQDKEKGIWFILLYLKWKLPRHKADKEGTLIKPGLLVWMCVCYFSPEAFFLRGTTVHLSYLVIGFCVISPIHFSNGGIDAVVLVPKILSSLYHDLIGI